MINTLEMEGQNKTPAITNTKALNQAVNRANQFFVAWQRMVDADIKTPFTDKENLKSMVRTSQEEFMNEYSSILKNQKAVTGGATATGEGLVNIEYNPIEEILDIKGGAFRNSGVRFSSEQIGTAHFPTATGTGDFTAATAGSSTTNDVTPTFYDQTVPINDYIAEIPIYNHPVLTSYVGSPAQLYSLFEAALEEKKKVLEDDLLAQALSGSGAITILPTSSATYAPIASSIQDLIVKRIRKYGRVKVYVNHDGMYRWLDERDADGNFPSLSAKFVFNNNSQEVPEVGRVGTFAGAEVHIVPKILSTYTTNASNAINAQTGGTKTAAFVGIPNMAGIARGRREFDTISVFNHTNDLTAFRTNQTIMGALTHMGANVLNPDAWGYYAFDV
jgi:hypothetical protein